MAAWYDDVVELLGLRVAVASGWRNTTKWWHGDASGSFFNHGTGAVAARGMGPASYHATGADGLLSKYYSPQLALNVTTQFREDLSRFGYAAWDGRRETAKAYLQSLEVGYVKSW